MRCLVEPLDRTSRAHPIGLDCRVFFKALEEVPSQTSSRTSQANECCSKLYIASKPQDFFYFCKLTRSTHHISLRVLSNLPFAPISEPVEHVFGWMRVLSPRFTVLDARMMMPKIHAIVKNVMSGKMKIPPSEHMHSGYQYAFSDEPESDDLKILAQFPTDSEISEDLALAYERANQLTTISGMGGLKSLMGHTPASVLEDLDETSPENFAGQCFFFFFR